MPLQCSKYRLAYRANTGVVVIDAEVPGPEAFKGFGLASGPLVKSG